MTRLEPRDGSGSSEATRAVRLDFLHKQSSRTSRDDRSVFVLFRIK